MIYLDNAAKTEITKSVLDEIMPYLTTYYANPSSLYSFGRKSKQAVEKARKQVANAIGAEPNQIIFTSCASESNNWVISNYGWHDYRAVLCSKVEHYSILNNPNCRTMDSSPLANQLHKNKAKLVSHMYVNNEIGEIYDIKSMCDICHKMNVPFHTDATQAFGHILIDVANLNVDFLSLSGHKFHCPTGVGILYIK